MDALTIETVEELRRKIERLEMENIRLKRKVRKCFSVGQWLRHLGYTEELPREKYIDLIDSLEIYRILYAPEYDAYNMRTIRDIEGFRKFMRKNGRDFFRKKK